MYGLVNRAIKGLVLRDFGESAWRRIAAQSGARDTEFVAMDAYDDAITYGLVAAASRELDMEPAAILEAFGEYWTTFTLEQGYGDLLAMMGGSLEEFLDNLDSMHTRIGGTLEGFLPPAFDREPQPDGSSILHYRSAREGLAPMVKGLLKGLAARFGVEIAVEELESLHPNHHRFRIAVSDDS